MRARIFQHGKNAMQSGYARSDVWMLVFEPSKRGQHDPLMGWWGSGDTPRQLRMSFATRDEAVAYAQAQGIPFDLEIPPVKHTPMKTYADNFRFGRKQNWTH